MGLGYMPAIEASPGCGRFSTPGLGIIPTGRCAARGDGVSARRQDSGLPAALSPLRPGERARPPRSASRASILKFFDFSIWGFTSLREWKRGGDERHSGGERRRKRELKGNRWKLVGARWLRGSSAALGARTSHQLIRDFGVFSPKKKTQRKQKRSNWLRNT